MEALAQWRKLLLAELINQTKYTIQPLNHSKSTCTSMPCWEWIKPYFRENEQVLFAEPLAQQFVSLSKDALDNGRIKLWRYKLRRLAVHLLIEVNQKGAIHELPQKDPDQLLSSTMVKLLQNYISEINDAGERCRDYPFISDCFHAVF